MKKIGILNKEISSVIAGMGHYHELIVCDSGFPIPAETQRIDVALEPGMPDFLTTLRVVLKELQVEQIILAQEIKTDSPQRLKEIQAMFPGIEPKFIPHEEFKQRSKKAVACIRSGDCIHYSNIILVAGVTF